ncbi:MAG: hypothetical protein V1867_03900 [Candidatus Falkowbacteria bacterium]
MKSTKTVTSDEFVAMIIKACDGFNINVVPEQIKEALGSIMNLYFAQAVNRGGLYQVETIDALVTPEVSREDILAEIKNATGIKEDERKEKLFTGILIALRAVFTDNTGEEIVIMPLGRFKSIGSKLDQYELLFEDPARSNYHLFLH